MEENQVIDNSVEEIVEETPVNEEVVANEGQAPIEEATPPEQQIEQPTQQFNDDRIAKAFSQRFNQEREKLRSQYEADTNARLERELTPYKKLVEIAAQEFGVTPEQYMETVREKYGLTEDKTSSNKQELPPDVQEKLDKYAAYEMAQEEQARWNNETADLLKINPELTVDDIPDAVLEMRAKDNIPLNYAYAYWQMTEGRQAFEKQIEEKTIKKLGEVNRTAGSLTSQQANIQGKSISDMNTEEFNALVERVKRGEVKNL